MNGDGLLDIITGELEGRIIYAFRKDNGELDSIKIMKANDTLLVFPDGISCEVLDLNGDGLFDMIISSGNREFMSMRIYYNSGSKEMFKFTDYVEPLFDGEILEAKYNTVESNDLDMDGDFDLIFSVTNDEGNTFQVFYSKNIGNSKKAEFGELVEINVDIDGAFNTEGYQGNRKNGLALGDLNGDGKPELALGGGSYGKCFQIYFNESETNNSLSDIKNNRIVKPFNDDCMFMINGRKIEIQNKISNKNVISNGIYINGSQKIKMIER